jgi:hypothetical protein
MATKKSSSAKKSSGKTTTTKLPKPGQEKILNSSKTTKLTGSGKKGHS